MFTSDRFHDGNTSLYIVNLCWLLLFLLHWEHWAVPGISKSFMSGEFACTFSPPPPRTLRPGIWDPGTWDSGTQELGLCNLGHFWPLDSGTRNLTLRTLELEHWDPDTSNLTPPQIALILFVKQILIIKSYGMYVEIVGFWIQKIKVRDIFVWKVG